MANELVTIILGEDVRARTNTALETTRFLEREQQRLESELASTEVKIADAKKGQINAAGSAATNTIEAQLLTLRSELILKSASYSDSHPDIKVLKQKIAALDKLLSKSNNSNNPELGA